MLQHIRLLCHTDEDYRQLLPQLNYLTQRYTAIKLRYNGKFELIMEP